MILNQIADDIRQHFVPRTSPWDEAKYSWIRNSSTSDKGRIGEWIAWKFFADRGRMVRESTSPQYDLLVDRDRVEVKLSCRNEDGGYRWLQVRPADDFTHIVLVAVDLEDIRAYLIPKSEVCNLKPQHCGTRGSMETRTLAAKPGESWLRPYEIAIVPPLRPLASTTIKPRSVRKRKVLV